MSSPNAISNRELMTELQTHGLRLVDPKFGAASRKGGAGPSDHKAVTIDGLTLMVPVHTSTAWDSPFLAEAPNELGESVITRSSIPIATIRFPKKPKFYDLTTKVGVPYSHIATLHSSDVLATTILQTCIRYESRKKACKFCAIGQSLAAGRTVAHKSPQQLAEVAKAAVELDGIKHMVLTTGTPSTDDRGASILCDSAKAIKAAVDLPLQGQCESRSHHPRHPGRNNARQGHGRHRLLHGGIQGCCQSVWQSSSQHIYLGRSWRHPRGHTRHL